MGCVDTRGTTLTLDCCVGGKQDVLWFGPAGFQGVFASELSDADPVSWLDVMAQLVTRRRLDSFYLSVD